VGHLDVIARAQPLFDEVIVAVLVNSAKSGRFSPEERLRFLSDVLGERPGVRIDVVRGGLLVEYCRSVEAVAVVKGLRSGTDFAYELPMALMNRHLTGLETVFLPGDPALEHISSSLVTEVSMLGGDVSGMVPDSVLAALAERRADQVARALQPADDPMILGQELPSLGCAPDLQ
jgi:pantetheine-phosphate adenylyltransferase